MMSRMKMMSVSNYERVDNYLPYQANMMSRMKMMRISNYEYQSVDKYLTCQANMMTDPSQTLDTLRLILQVA